MNAKSKPDSAGQVALTLHQVLAWFVVLAANHGGESRSDYAHLAFVSSLRFNCESTLPWTRGLFDMPHSGLLSCFQLEMPRVPFGGSAANCSLTLARLPTPQQTLCVPDTI